MKLIDFKAWYILNVWPMVNELGEATAYYEDHPSYKNALERLKFDEMLEAERDAYKKAAEDWMNDYDKLKEKYEPTVIIISE